LALLRVGSAAAVLMGSAARAGYKSSPQEEHLAHLSSSDTPVVVMEPTEHGDCVDAAIRLEWLWNRLLVPESLVRTRFIVEAHVLSDDAP
jgi:predicted aldo/keto reductase-like oxidoreductase